MPDPIRHPWIAGAETPDLIRGRNDSLLVQDAASAERMASITAL